VSLKTVTHWAAIGIGLLSSPSLHVASADELPAQVRDIREVEPDLEVPPMVEGEPEPGKRVRQVLPGYSQTAVYHTLYLPMDWQADQRYPLIVEYAGNGGYRNLFGDESTGMVEGSKLGYGISAGRAFLWVCLPYLDDAGEANVQQWWGDKPAYSVAPTVAYCLKAVPWICDRYGGDPGAVVLTGFSRGAIACNFIGLHNDEIAGLWRAFVPFSHYDGVVESWPYPGADRRSALERLGRLGGRPQFICAESLPGNKATVETTRRYLESTGVAAPWAFLPTGFRNHNDAWILRPSPARTALRKWLKDVLADRADRSR
jgi:hypothetical protein